MLTAFLFGLKYYLIVSGHCISIPL